MPAHGPEIRWHAGGSSVRGSLHVRDGRPNQDAVDFVSRGGIAVVAVADGHGGGRHFRSETGSRLAVAVAREVLAALPAKLASAPATERLALASTLATQRIVEDWTVAVQAHLATQPLDDRELWKLAETEGEEASADVVADPLLAYGATLLAALAFRQGVLLLQLGDGDILAVAEDGAVSRPLPADERLVGNVTTSLCRPSAVADFRAALLPSAPALLLLSTDGYANSYRTDEDFLQVGRDYLEMIRAQGWETVLRQLPDFLGHTTEDGSGDDISLGLLTPDDGAAGPATAVPRVHDEELTRVREQLAAVERRHDRLRKLAMIAVLIVLAGIGWLQREALATIFAAKPTPLEGAGPAGLKPAKATGRHGELPPPASGPALPDLPARIPEDSGKAAPDALTAEAKPGLSDFSARAADKFITLSAKVVRPESRGACEVEATLWNGKDAKLKTIVLKLAATAAAIDETATIPIPVPADDKAGKAYRDPLDRASMRLVCNGRTIDETGHMKIDR